MDQGPELTGHQTSSTHMPGHPRERPRSQRFSWHACNASVLLDAEPRPASQCRVHVVHPARTRTQRACVAYALHVLCEPAPACSVAASQGAARAILRPMDASRMLTAASLFTPACIMKVKMRFPALWLSILVALVAMATSKQVDSPDVGVPYLYKGLITWAFFFAFLDAFTIGANDVANAFANAVGAGTVTHRQACLIACIFEFVGVVALGKDVTDTIRKRMVEVEYFKHDPYVLATGMSMVNVGSGLWVLGATFLAMPVSTTHSVVGATLGVGITAFGWGGVVWSKPPIGGFAGVAASWFISPVLSGTLAAIFFMSVKVLVLQYPKEEGLRRGIALMPLYMFFAFGTIWGFMFNKGIPALKKAPIPLTAGLTVGLAVFHCILGFIIVQPWLRRRIVDREDLPWYTIFYTPCVAVGQYGYRTQDKMEMKPQQQMPYGFPGAAMPMNPYGMPVMGAAFGNDQGVEALGKALAPGFYQENVGAKREEEAGMHAAAFQTDDIVEELFKFLQLTSCCFFSMSHGANDVANAVGPFAAVWMIYSTGKIEKKADVDIWILIYGGIALDIGLLTMGHVIMSALGNRLTLQTPSRGFCIELGAMFTVMIASKLGIPVSTTHCITGSTVAVGLCNGNVESVNWKLLAIIFFGWIITCPSAAFITGMLFWGVCSSPTPVIGNEIFEGKVPLEYRK